MQEKALDKLFLETYPYNIDIREILVKASTLNCFYSTNIYSIFQVTKHIHNLNIDKKLYDKDTTIVYEIALVNMYAKYKTSFLWLLSTVVIII